MSKVSVIIPVFGVENYIERCAKSLFNQTLDDIEFIFINDCTKDNSIAILERVIKEYPQRANQIKIITHKVNKGLPIARQTGLKAATGDFIAHCDSDDWVSPCMYEKMYNEAKRTKSDIVICDFYTSDGVKSTPQIACHSTNNDDFICNCLCGLDYWAVWNKLVKKDLYLNITEYPTQNMGEDMVLILQLAYHAQKISYISESYYYYFQNVDSMCKSTSQESIIKNFVQAKENLSIIERFFSNKFISKRYSTCLIFTKYRFKNLLLPLIKEWEYYKIWNKSYPEILFRIFTNKYITTKKKTKFYLNILSLGKKVFY